MEIKIIAEKLNKLFSRREIQLEVVCQVTPSEKESIKIVAEELKVDKNFVRVRNIGGKFGINLFVITADVYESEDGLNSIVKKTKQEIEAKKKEEEGIEAKKKEEEKKDVKIETSDVEKKIPLSLEVGEINNDEKKDENHKDKEIMTEKKE